MFAVAKQVHTKVMKSKDERMADLQAELEMVSTR